MSLSRRELFSRIFRGGASSGAAPAAPPEGAAGDELPAHGPDGLLECYRQVLGRHAEAIGWGIPLAELPAEASAIKQAILEQAAAAESAGIRDALRVSYGTLGWFREEREIAALRAGKSAFDAQDWSETGKAAVTAAFALRKVILAEVSQLSHEFDGLLRRSAAKLRLASVEDAASIARVWMAARQAGAHSAARDPRHGGLDQETERWTELLALPSAATVVIALGNEVLGACRVVESAEAGPGGPSGGEIESLFVVPSEWGWGYGEMLLHGALAELSARGVDEVIAWAPDGHAIGSQLLGQAGFVGAAEARSDPAFPGSTLRQILFRRSGGSHADDGRDRPEPRRLPLR